MALGAYRGATRQAAGTAARPAVVLMLCLLAGLMLSACNTRASQPIPVASIADLAAPDGTAPTDTAPADTAPTGTAAREGSEPVAETRTSETRTTAMAALPGDAAAAEDAGPPAEEAYAAADPADPDEMMGLGRIEVEALLGQPGLVRREAPAEVWQYQSRGCVLDVFLYEAAADLEVIYLEARNVEAVSAATATCLGSVMDERRRTPTS